MTLPLDKDRALSPDTFNIASRLTRTAKAIPYHRAVVVPTGRTPRGQITYAHLTFRQLDKESDCLAHGLNRIGIGEGTRTILMVRPCLEFFALIFALFKAGAIPVVVDPGMGVRRMAACYRQTKPQAFIGIPLAHVVRLLLPRFFRDIKTKVTLGKRYCWGGTTYNHICSRPWTPYTAARTHRDQTAAILFTTGSTGPAKGVVYTHGNFDAQIRRIQSHFDITAGEIDLPTFPLFALFDPALGMTAVIPEMNPTCPAKVDPHNIIRPIIDHGVTNMFASPALLNRVGAYGKDKKIKLPSLKRVVSAGAPVAPANIEQFSAMLRPKAQIHTPYGATEAVPVLSIASDEILGEIRTHSEKGYGICVGRPIDDILVEIITISDDPIAEWSDSLVVKDGEIGEITVKGDLVTQYYFNAPEADALAKIDAGDALWHRMGDLGWRDHKGRIWFCGRKSQRVITTAGTLYTIPCEAIFNNHPHIYRSALVGVGATPDQTPVICIELMPEAASVDREGLKRELLQLASKGPSTQSIKTILFHDDFPVDIRHNAKIFREKLAQWAQGQIETS